MNKQKTNDMTVGNPVRLIIQFMIPMFLGNIFQQFYNIVDSIVAGQFIGVDALAAIGSTGSLMFFVTGWLNGLSSGFAIIVAQMFGAKKYDDMRHFVAMSIYLMFGFAAAMTIGFLGFNVPILRLMNSPADLMGDVAGYMGIIYAGLLVTAAYNTLAAFLRDHFSGHQCCAGYCTDSFCWNGSRRLCICNCYRTGRFSNLLPGLYKKEISDSSS